MYPQGDNVHNRFVRFMISVSLFIGPLLASPRPVVAATDIVLSGPPGSSEFGQQVLALGNGNIVVTDPSFSANGKTAIGAVYLYDGDTGALISTLTGSASGDQVSSGGVIALPSDNVVMLSPSWHNGSIANAGAATWIDGDTGASGVVSIANSLIGSHANDQVGTDAWVLANGNVVVRSPHWANGTTQEAGAVTWIDGAVGLAGAIEPTNSLVGSHGYDQVGFSSPVVALDNGNYLLMSDYWDNGAAANAGAVTWGNGSTGTTGVVSPANSLVGTTPGMDFVQSLSTVVLSDGDYVVACPRCDIGGVSVAGAVAWGSGTTGVAGAFSATNSLVGPASGDLLDVKVFPLSNGNYVVSSPGWDNGGVMDAGAVTWASGDTGRVGAINASNSLIGSTLNDRVGDDDSYDNNERVWALTNGNYVVCSGMWDNGSVVDAGAVTWGNGNTGVVGVVSASNSLVGSAQNDHVGWDMVTVLTNGHYVVASPQWDNGAIIDAGASTWGNGTLGVTGTISATNSLVGSSANDGVGYATALSNGHYVVRSPLWDNGAISNAGAATWANGAAGRTGTISALNSLVGSYANDYVGLNVVALTNGNYVVVNTSWHNLSAVNVGAITWGNGSTGITGTISAANSLVSPSANDLNFGVTPLANGNYVVRNVGFDNGAVANVGAITWGDGSTGVVGLISSSNSLIGTTANDRVGEGDDFAYESIILFPDGNYVVKSPGWDNGAAADAGAVTWASGTQPLVGTVSASNSLVGSSSGDRIGGYYQDLKYEGSDVYILSASTWDFGAISNAGAVAFASTAAGSYGPLTGIRSVHGSVTDGILRAEYDGVHHQYIVGLPKENRVILRRTNLAPTAAAGPDQTVPTSASVTLDGSVSADADGDTPLAYTWSQSGGPAVSLNNPTSAHPTFTAPASPTMLTFSLVVNDSWSQASTVADEVVISVVTPVAPTSVTLVGPVIGAADHGQAFRADVSPLSTTGPVTYTWEVTGRSPITHVGGITDTLTLTETVVGSHTVNVTAENGFGAPVSDSQVIQIVAGNQSVIDPSAGGTLTFSGAGQGNTQILVPAGAITATTTLLLQPLSPASSLTGYSFAGAGFALSASQDGTTFGAMTFAAPVTITLTYTDEQLGGQSEGTLRLVVRSGSNWVDAATTCTPQSTYLREPSLNRVSVAICHLSEYAWFGQQQVFLPFLRR